MRARLFAMLTAAALVACIDDAPTAVQDMPTRAQPIIRVSDQRVASIQAVVDALEAAANANDFAAHAAKVAEDVEAIGPAGRVFSGRAAWQALLQESFEGAFAPATERLTLRRVQFLTGTIAVADVDSELTGYLALPPGWRETEPGVVRTRLRWVMAKRGSDWEIVALQMTQIAPAS